MKKLYSKSERKIDKMLSINELVKNIRTMKTALKFSIMTQQIKSKIEMLDNHVIDIDDSKSMTSSNSSDEVI